MSRRMTNSAAAGATAIVILAATAATAAAAAAAGAAAAFPQPQLPASHFCFTVHCGTSHNTHPSSGTCS
jgi:invasion protein IalB